MSGHDAGVTRRQVLGLAAGALAVSLVPAGAFAENLADTPLHGLSAFGDLKYPPGFTHFAYLDPDAPKGGTLNFSAPNWLYNQNVTTFNTLNSFVLTGDAPPRMELCFDSLMTRALDEPDAIYGLLAETVAVSADRNSFTFRLRPEARWHDGTPLTAEDVAFTYDLFKEKGHPSLMLPLAEMTGAEIVDPSTVRLTFSGKQPPTTILSVATYPIVSKAWFSQHPFDSSQLVAPLGSGPYRVGRVSAGQTIVYERVEEYWGRDLPVNRGSANFDRIRIDVFRDRQAEFEAFKKGEVTYRQEFTARLWATGYDFPALKQGKVIRREFPSERRASMQGWAINQRRPRFRDARVRRAIACCFNFEWTNRNLFYDLYERSQSCFQRSEFMAEGLPSPEELALLEPWRDEIPEEAFGEAVLMPVSNGSGRDRKLLGEASRLLAEAGWQRKGQLVRNEKGESLPLEFLIDDEVFLRVCGPFVENLRAVGIDASIRQVDAAQYAVRQNDYDFDIVMFALGIAATPGFDGLQAVFHSRAAATPGTRNLPGTSSPAIDSLITTAGNAADRQELVTALRALDRVLRARLDWIPNWYSANHRAAFWDVFGFVEPKPDYGFPIETMWWFDKDRAAAIGKA